ncbi:epigen-like [Carcharodon carcharias]|uniref:epigen-like n=1 Tax=Carcharodon carcharias TaxID=13397 RepID=UPI001B7E69BF|nr:epigen-like [Carcharodon carcharias]
MESVTGGSIFIINAILALATATSEHTQLPITEPLHTFNVSQNTSDALETIMSEHKENPDVPRALEVKHSCYEGGQNYCMNGDCRYHEDQVTRYRMCVCKAGYMGERCQHLTLPSHTAQESERYLYITVGIGIGLFFSGLIALLYYCCRNRCQRSKTMYSKCSIQARV